MDGSVDVSGTMWRNVTARIIEQKRRFPRAITFLLLPPSFPEYTSAELARGKQTVHSRTRDYPRCTFRYSCTHRAPPDSLGITGYASPPAKFTRMPLFHSSQPLAYIINCINYICHVYIGQGTYTNHYFYYGIEVDIRICSEGRCPAFCRSVPSRTHDTSWFTLKSYGA